MKYQCKIILEHYPKTTAIVEILLKYGVITGYIFENDYYVIHFSDWSQIPTNLYPYLDPKPPVIGASKEISHILKK